MPFSCALEVLNIQWGVQREKDVALFWGELYGCIDVRAESAPHEAREVEQLGGETFIRCGAEQVKKCREDINRLYWPVLYERQKSRGHDEIELDRFCLERSDLRKMGEDCILRQIERLHVEVERGECLRQRAVLRCCRDELFDWQGCRTRLRLQVFGGIGNAAAAEFFEPCELAAVQKGDPQILGIMPNERVLRAVYDVFLERFDEPVQRECRLCGWLVICAYGDFGGGCERREQCLCRELCRVFLVDFEIVFREGIFGFCIASLCRWIECGDIIRPRVIVFHEVRAVFFGRIDGGFFRRRL